MCEMNENRFSGVLRTFYHFDGQFADRGVAHFLREFVANLDDLLEVLAMAFVCHNQLRARNRRNSILLGVVLVFRGVDARFFTTQEVDFRGLIVALLLGDSFGEDSAEASRFTIVRSLHLCENEGRVGLDFFGYLSDFVHMFS